MGAKGPPRRELANSRGCVGIRGCGGYPPLRRLSAAAAVIRGCGRCQQKCEYRAVGSVQQPALRSLRSR
jgi:hypothetical protein